MDLDKEKRMKAAIERMEKRLIERDQATAVMEDMIMAQWRLRFMEKSRFPQHPLAPYNTDLHKVELEEEKNDKVSATDQEKEDTVLDKDMFRLKELERRNEELEVLLKEKDVILEKMRDDMAALELELALKDHHNG